MRYMTQKNFFGLRFSIERQVESHFWLQGPLNGPRRGVLEKFVLFRYSLTLASIFMMQVDFQKLIKVVYSEQLLDRIEQYQPQAQIDRSHQGEEKRRKEKTLLSTPAKHVLCLKHVLCIVNIQNALIWKLTYSYQLKIVDGLVQYAPGLKINRILLVLIKILILIFKVFTNE